MERELISIIIPVYNIGAYLSRCLETVAMQSYQNLEIILVDDGSTDDSGRICDSFAEQDNRAIVIHQQNEGPGVARNTGKRVAKGDYIMFVDGDDYMHVDAVKVLYEAINEEGGYDMAMFDRKKTKRFDEDIYVQEENKATVLSQRELINNMFNTKNGEQFFYLWNKLYRRNLIESLWFEVYPTSEDFDYNFRTYIKIQKVIWVHRILYFYVQRMNSVVHQSNAYNIYYQCITSILFQNYNNLSPSIRSLYGHYLLRSLYRKLVFFKTRNHDKQETIIQQYRKYKKSTCKAYWFCRQIPLYEKVCVTLLLDCPILTHWLMKMTKNY